MPDTTRSGFIGSSLILAGTAIGAGMLALPLVAASTGLLLILIVFFVIAGFAVLSGLLILEANLAIEPGCNLYTMSSRTLGSAGRILSTIAPLALFYALMTAYLSGGGALFSQYVNVVVPGMPLQVSILLFAVFSGVVVYCSTRVVDYSNRLLFMTMVVCLLIALLVLFPEAQYQRLIHASDVDYLPLMAAIPVVFTSFGYHGSIPSIILYQQGRYRSIPKIIIVATTISLLVYIAWLICVMGNISYSELIKISHSTTATSDLIQALVESTGNKSHLRMMLHIFSDFALLTSVLGVALGLFDYLAGLLRRSDNREHRAQTALITFAPPMIFAMTYPEIFISSLGFAAIPLAILAIFLPSAMVLHIRQNASAEPVYRAPGGNLTVYLCFLFGVVMILTQLIAFFT